MAHLAMIVMCLAAAVGVLGVSCLPTNDQIKKNLEKQRDDLAKLGCEPRPALVNIEKELGPFNPLADRPFYPHVVAVKRCLKECSFCGNPMVGIPSHECLPQPTGLSNYTVVLSFFDSPERESIVIEEHTSCKCG